MVYAFTPVLCYIYIYYIILRGLSSRSVIVVIVVIVYAAHVQPAVAVIAGGQLYIYIYI